MSENFEDDIDELIKRFVEFFMDIILNKDPNYKYSQKLFGILNSELDPDTTTYKFIRLIKFFKCNKDKEDFRKLLFLYAQVYQDEMATQYLERSSGIERGIL